MKSPTFTFADLVLPFHPPRECFIEFSAFNTQMPPVEIEDGILMEYPLMFSPPKFMWGWTMKRVSFED